MQPENKPSNFGQVLGINLLVVVGSALVLGLLSRAVGVGFLFVFAAVYLGQVLANVVLGFVNLGKGAAAYFLSALLVLIIGFGSCTGLLAWLDGSGGALR